MRFMVGWCPVNWEGRTCSALVQRGTQMFRNPSHCPLTFIYCSSEIKGTHFILNRNGCVTTEFLTKWKSVRKMYVMWTNQTGNVQTHTTACPSTYILSSSKAFHFYHEGTYMKWNYNSALNLYHPSDRLWIWLD